MSNHLPECFWPDVPERSICICDRLRACEQRVMQDAYSDGRTDALDAAERAVAELTEKGDSVRPADVMVAIRALKEKLKQPYAPDLQYLCFDGCCENNCPIVTCKYCGHDWPCPDYIANHTPAQVEAQHRYVDRKWYGDDKEMVDYSARKRALKEKP